MNSVRNTYPTVGIPCQGKPRETLHSGLNIGHTLQMPQMLLRHGPRMSRQVYRLGRAGDAQEALQLRVDGLLHRGIRAVQLLGL